MANFGFRFKGDKTCFEVVSDDYEAAEIFDLHVITSPLGDKRYAALRCDTVNEVINSCVLYSKDGDFRDQSIVMEYKCTEDEMDISAFTITVDFRDDEWTHVVVEW